VCVCVCRPYRRQALLHGLHSASTEHIDTIAQDLWSVACLMYEMITRHQLFQALDIYNDATDDATEILGLHTEMVG